jgi:malonyl-CoA O-methyltransferase
LLAAWPVDADGRLPASFEIVYGHAWKPEPRQIADGRAVVTFRSR